MGLFKKTTKPVKAKASKTVMAAAPEMEETPGEIKHIEQLTNHQKITEVPSELPDLPEFPEYKEVPVCLSQTQINNLVLENNIMLKQIMSEL